MCEGTYAGDAVHAGDRIIAFRTADRAPCPKDRAPVEPETVRDWQPGDRIRTIRDINLFNRRRHGARAKARQS